MKTPRQHNLPIDEDYYFVDAYEADEVITCCDNCDRPIRNVATIKNSQGKQYGVGMDCVEVLLNECGSYLRESVAIKQAKKEFTRLKAIKRLAKNGKLVVALETLENPHREYWYAFDIDNPQSCKYWAMTQSSDLMTQLIEILMEQPMIAARRFDARGIAWAYKNNQDYFYEWDSELQRSVKVNV